MVSNADPALLPFGTERLLISAGRGPRRYSLFISGGFAMHSPKRSGFTLIELLVVIAIIAILAAILFPVFAQAREKARATSCVCNAKQLGLSMRMYIQDYDETYPSNW